jgi:hypothetical protein
MEKLHSESGRQRILKISWQDFSNPDTGPGADIRIPSVPLLDYRSLSFFMRRPRAANVSEQSNLDEGTLHFIIGRGPGHRDEIALEALVPLSAFSGKVEPGRWARVDIQYRGSGQKVFIEG